MVAGAESISQAAGRLALHADRPVRVLCSIVYDLRGGQVSAPRIYLPISMLVEQITSRLNAGPTAIHSVRHYRVVISGLREVSTRRYLPWQPGVSRSRVVKLLMDTEPASVRLSTEREYVHAHATQPDGLGLLISCARWTPCRGDRRFHLHGLVRRRQVSEGRRVGSLLGVSMRRSSF
jgi:hypothetical protein